MHCVVMKNTAALDIGKQCHSFMRRFWNSREGECNTAKEECSREFKCIKKFPTGSEYTGTMLGEKMDSSGMFIFPNSVIYRGELKDGEFHGYGKLFYEDGVIVQGFWEEGVLSDREIIFPNGLVYEEQEWMYCKMPDRRFTLEYKDHVQPAGRSYLTEEQPTGTIPSGHYDTGDGYYDPKNFVVKKKDQLFTLARAPKPQEQYWITKNCRYGTDESIGPADYLYEVWSKPQLKLRSEPAPLTHVITAGAICSVSQELDSDTPFSGNSSSYGPDIGRKFT